MRNCLVLFVLLFLPWLKGVGQCPLSNSAIFTTQEQVESFPKNYPNCKSLSYHLKITDGVSSLDSLYGIESCKELIIENTYHLKSLKGLSGLKDMKSIDIVKNKILLDISDLRPSNVVNIQISNNPELREINCFDSLITLNTLTIYSNNNLNAITSFNNRIEAVKLIDIGDNSNLINLDNFKLCKSVSVLNILANPQLQTVNFLNGIQNFTEQLVIRENESLLALDFLAVKNFNPSTITIQNNNSLKTIRFSWIKSNSIVSFSLIDNKSLFKIWNAPFVKMKNVAIAYNNKLEDIDFLTGITSVTDYMIISDNHLLQNVDALSKLRQTGNIQIDNNWGLKNISGLDSCSEIRDLTIQDNYSLLKVFSNKGGTKKIENLIIKRNASLLEINYPDSISILNSLVIDRNNKLMEINLPYLYDSKELAIQIITNYALRAISMPRIVSFVTLQIMNNTSLEYIGDFAELKNLENLSLELNTNLNNLTGLETLNVLYTLSVWHNDRLKTLSQMKNLRYIYSNIDISYNMQLHSIFYNLIYCKGNMNISNNLKLTDISGIQNVKDLANYSIINNPALNKCAIESICISLENDSAHTIELNGLNCSSSSHVESECSKMSQGEFIHPNPVRNILNFTDNLYNGVAFVSIYDSKGKMVYQIETSSNGVDIGHLNTGCYFIQVKSDNLNFNQKFLKY